MGTKRSLAHALTRDSGARLFFMFWAALVNVDVVDAAHASAVVALGSMALVVLLASRGQHLGTATATAAMGWLFVNGFYENRLGVLRWHGEVDLPRLLLLLAAAVAGSLVRMDGAVTLARVGSAPFRHPVRIGK